LPRTTASLPTEAATEDANPRPRAVKSRRILVVDDNEDAAKSLALLLDHLGNQVGLAHNGREAIDLVDEFRPDVVIMDIGMPEMSGYEAAAALRERDGLKGLVLIAMTGWGQEEDRKRSMLAGFDFHLVKPVPLGSLQDLLGRI
jgi:CheY-like chemotaxis protein